VGSVLLWGGEGGGWLGGRLVVFCLPPSVDLDLWYDGLWCALLDGGGDCLREEIGEDGRCGVGLVGGLTLGEKSTVGGNGAFFPLPFFSLVVGTGLWWESE